MDNKWNLPLRSVPEQANKDKSIVWNAVTMSYEQKLFGQITNMSYNTAGTVLGTTSSNQLVLLRVPQKDGVIVNEQTERKNFSIKFRDDDKLYIQSVDQRVVVKSSETAFERQFVGHTREVRSAIFLGKHNFVSGSDDTTIKMWDLLSENELATAQIHTDYVRCLENYTSGCFFSGSYDHSVHLWDPRAGIDAPLQSSGSCLNAAVEALCFLSGTDIVSCGSGDQVTLFDVRKGLSVPLFQGSFHTKSVVSLAYSTEHKTLLSASLDCRVKMFTLEGDSLQCLTTKKFDTPLTCVAVHPGGKEFAVGSSTGELKVYRLPEEKKDDEDQAEAHLLGMKVEKKNALEDKMHAVQHQLGIYQYGKALKTALYSRHPDVIVSTFEELIRRGALHVALNNQNDRTVVRVLRFASEFVDKPQFTDSMIDVIEVIFEIYGTVVGKSAFLHREMMIAQKRIGASLAVLQRMEKTMGIMDLIVNAE